MWEALWPAWGAPVHNRRAPHTPSTAPSGRRPALWFAGDGLGDRKAAPTRENRRFSPIPTTTPSTTDQYL